MGLEITFNEDALNYDRIRPAYPAQLFSDIFAYAAVDETKAVLEIGIGTGQATAPFLQQGCGMTAIELGDKLADFSREKFAGYPNIQIIQSDFMQYALPENSYDLVFSATAFHWLPREQRCKKVYGLLKSGGAVALFWNHPFTSRADDRTNVASKQVYNRYRPCDRAIPEFSEKDCETYISELRENGFTDIQSKLYRRVRSLATEDYIRLLNTYSDHRMLPSQIKTDFEQDMRRAIGGVGGYIRIYDTIDLYLARKA